MELSITACELTQLVNRPVVTNPEPFRIQTYDSCITSVATFQASDYVLLDDWFQWY